MSEPLNSCDHCGCFPTKFSFTLTGWTPMACTLIFGSTRRDVTGTIDGTYELEIMGFCSGTVSSEVIPTLTVSYYSDAACVVPVLVGPPPPLPWVDIIDRAEIHLERINDTEWALTILGILGGTRYALFYGKVTTASLDCMSSCTITNLIASTDITYTIGFTSYACLGGDGDADLTFELIGCDIGHYY